MKNITTLLSIIIAIAGLAIAGSAQTRRTPGTPKAVVAPAVLPPGGTKITPAEIPASTKKEVTNLVDAVNTASGKKWLAGTNEAVFWSSPSQNRAKTGQLIAAIKASLEKGGWTYTTVGGENSDLVFVELTLPARKAGGIYSITENSLLFLAVELTEVKTAATGKPSPTPKPSPSPAPAPKGTSVAGKWNMVVQAQGQYIPVTLELTQNGTAVTGRFTSHIGNGTVQNGTVSGNALSAIAKIDFQGQMVDLRLEGTVSGDQMTGTLEGDGLPSFSFKAERVK